MLVGFGKMEIMSDLDQNCIHLEVEGEARLQVHEASET